MKRMKELVVLLAAVLASGPLAAQDSEAAKAEAARQEEARVVREEVRVRQVEVEREMRDAEERLTEAAQRIAELSARQLPRVVDIQRRLEISNRPMLGITIGGEGDGPVEGVAVAGVSPGGAAAEAGLRAGDLITAVNGESLTSPSASEANNKLLDFMAGVVEGDLLEIDYLRNGKSAKVELTPRKVDAFAFMFGPGGSFTAPVAPAAPGAMHRWAWIGGDSGFGDMELVSLTERLGSYFGTDNGLLVVRAPENEELKLEDGDVIQRIDGREPASVSHAMRILGSYQGGEKLEIEIMRDRKRQKISIEMPDNRQSRLSPAAPRFAPRATPPVRPAPAPPVAPAPKDAHERT